MEGFYLGEMSWKDVDPSGHTFDLDRIRQVAEKHTVALPDEDALQSVEFDLHHALLAEFGYWIQGWRWTARDTGGPVRAWQDAHSLLYDEEETSNEPAANRVASALRQHFFDQPPPPTHGALGSGSAIPR